MDCGLTQAELGEATGGLAYPAVMQDKPAALPPAGVSAESDQLSALRATVRAVVERLTPSNAGAIRRELLALLDTQ
jgi:hypothetical protein